MIMNFQLIFNQFLMNFHDIENYNLKILTISKISIKKISNQNFFFIVIKLLGDIINNLV